MAPTRQVSDPDFGDAIFGNGDLVTIRFDMATDRASPGAAPSEAAAGDKVCRTDPDRAPPWPP